VFPGILGVNPCHHVVTITARNRPPTTSGASEVITNTPRNPSGLPKGTRSLVGM